MYLRYVCSSRKCIPYQTAYTVGPQCCSGYANSHSSFVANRSSNVNKILKEEGCPIGEAVLYELVEIQS